MVPDLPPELNIMRHDAGAVTTILIMILPPMQTIVDQLVNLTLAGKVVLFCGAGVSFNSGLPLAAEFTARILGELGLSTGEQNAISQALPFEAIMEVVSAFRGFPFLLSCFGGGAPNENHLLCADLAAAGKLNDLATTNFDGIFERAMTDRRVSFCTLEREEHFSELARRSPVARVIKIHGSLSDPQSVRVTLADVAKQLLASGRKQALEFVFRDGPHEAVVVLGYSCSDSFDIVPHIKSLTTSTKIIFFVQHEEGRSGNAFEIAPLPETFQRYDGHRIRCNTDALVAKLRSELLGSKMLTAPARKSPVHRVAPTWGTKVTTWAGKFRVYERLAIAGALFRKMSNWRMAGSYYGRSRDLASECGDEEFQRHVSRELAQCQFKTGDLEVAKSLSEGIRMDDADTAKAAYLALSSRFDEAITLYLKVIDAKKDRGDKKELMELYTHLGVAFKNAERLDEATSTLLLAKALAEELGDVGAQCRGHINLGNVCVKHGLGNTAQAYYCKAIAIAKIIGDRESELVARHCVANGLREAGKYVDAERQYHQAADIAATIGAHARRAACLLSLGIMLDLQGRPADAIPYYHQALDHGPFVEIRHDVVCQTYIGAAYAKCGDFARATVAHETALRLSRALNDAPLLKMCRHNLILDYRATGDWAKIKALEKQK